MILRFIKWLLSLFKKAPEKQQPSEEVVFQPPKEEVGEIEETMTYFKKDGKVIFDVSLNRPNYGQRNNEYKWSHPKNSALTMDALSMCNVTSMVMALDYLDYKFPSGKYSQPEDNLCDFMFTSKEVDDFYKLKMPAMWEQFNRGDSNAYCPNLVHIVLAYATNLWMGTNCVTFHDAYTINDIIREITINQRPVVMSGTFPYKYANGTVGTIGHINCLVGARYNEADFAERKLAQPPVDFIVDDPYGNWKQNFIAGTGNDTIFTYNEFVKYYKTLNNGNHKMAHIFKNSAAVI